MRAKIASVRRPARDYPTTAAIFAILLSVAVLVGIAYRYAADPNQAMTLLRA